LLLSRCRCCCRCVVAVAVIIVIVVTSSHRRSRCIHCHCCVVAVVVVALSQSSLSRCCHCRGHVVAVVVVALLLLPLPRCRRGCRRIVIVGRVAESTRPRAHGRGRAVGSAQLRVHTRRGRCEAEASVNEGGGGCHTCGTVSQDIPEIWGDIALPKGDMRCEGRGKGGRRGRICCRCHHHVVTMVVIIGRVAESTRPRARG
jgi:hypothetical protein